MGRILFHIDMNSFFASVEQTYQPELKGKPIAVAGNPKARKGIVITCSYEARARGVYTTMNVSEAKRICPELILVTPTFSRYKEASQRMFDLLKSYTPLVEPVSIDEGYVDVSELCETRSAVELATEIQKRILHELDLPCSIGIAPNKFLAKMASGMKKPMGITILRKRELHRTIWTLPVEKMHGIGDKTATKLHHANFHTIGDLAASDVNVLIELLGKSGRKIYDRANGDDEREVDPNSIFETKSVGNSMTLPVDETDSAACETFLNQLSEKVSVRLATKSLAGYTISVQIRSADWKNYSKSKTLREPLYEKQSIYMHAVELFHKLWKNEPIRLLGVTVSNVVDKSDLSEQLSIFSFEKHAKEEPIIQLLETIQTKYGKKSIQKGVKGVENTKETYSSSFQKDFLRPNKEEND